MKKFYILCVTLFITTLSFGQGLETFTNLPLSGTSYATGSFTGDNGVTWNYVECRDENGDEFSSGIVGKAVLLRTTTSPGPGSISANSGANGVGELSMKLYKAFSSTTLRQVDVYVNGTLYGTSPGFDDTAEHIYVITGINKTGNVLIEIKNTKSAQIIVDDVKWSAFGTTLSTPKNQIEGFALYPNPVVNGKFTIASKSNVPKQVEIYSLLGKRMIDKVVKINEVIEVSNLSKGIYILKVEEEGKTAVRKLVIQ